MNTECTSWVTHFDKFTGSLLSGGSSETEACDPFPAISNTGHRRLHIVDPSRMDYLAALDQLARQGVKIRTCGSGAEALNLPTGPEVTCIISESLPDVPCSELCEQLRKAGTHVILTGQHRNPQTTPPGTYLPQVPYVGRSLLPLWLAQCLFF